MGGSSLKSFFFWKKKKSPLQKAFSQVKSTLPKRKSKGILEKLNSNKRKKDNHFKKRFSLTKDKKDKKASTPLKRLSLANIRKDSLQNASAGRKEKDRVGLGQVREQIKNTFSKKNKELSAPTEVLPSPANPNAENEDKMSKKKLKEIMKLAVKRDPKEKTSLEQKTE